MGLIAEQNNEKYYADVWFEGGHNLHNGAVFQGIKPTKPGYYAVFNHQGDTEVGTFETAREAYSVGVDFADFSHVYYLDSEGVMHLNPPIKD